MTHTTSRKSYSEAPTAKHDFQTSALHRRGGVVSFKVNRSCVFYGNIPRESSNTLGKWKAEGRSLSSKTRLPKLSQTFHCSKEAASILQLPIPVYHKCWKEHGAPHTPHPPTPTNMRAWPSHRGSAAGATGAGASSNGTPCLER